MKNDKNMCKNLTKEDVLKFKYVLTVGQLRKFIEKHNISDDAPILVQRIEDVYFDKHNWPTYRKHTFESTMMIDSWDNCSKVRLTDAELESYKSDYIPTNQPVYYKEDKEILFIDLHI